MTTENGRNGGAGGRITCIGLGFLQQRKFALGELIVTKKAQAKLSPADLIMGVGRHLAGDWGELDQCDRRQNEIGLREGRELLSAYRSSKGVEFWIVTAWDRSSTTILLPEED